MDGGRLPEPSDIPRATALARRVGHGAVVGTAAIAATRSFIQSSS
jgi:hypothetical protein